MIRVLLFTTLLSLLLILSVDPANGDVLVFDFEDGPGPLFETVNTGDLWTVDTDGPDLRISKPEDPLEVNPHGFIRGGIQSTFSIEGDFTMTVDYVITLLPRDDSNSSTLNESLLGADDASQSFQVLRYVTGGSSVQRIEAFGPHEPIGDQPAPPEVLWSGRYRISRSDQIMSGWFAPLGSDEFTLLGSSGYYDGPITIYCIGVQGLGNSSYERANTALDITFDNLIIEGDIAYPTSGACCLNAYCLITTEEECHGYGGTFEGIGTVCEPNPCPTSGIPDGSLSADEGAFDIAPVPSHGPVTIRLQTESASSPVVTIYDVTGALVRSLKSIPGGKSSAEWFWEGTNEHGQPVPSGIYFSRAVPDGKPTLGRITIIR